MGLDCTHDAFSGAYTAFNRLRQFVCLAADGSYPPHWAFDEDGEIIKDAEGWPTYRTDVGPDEFILGGYFTKDRWPGLHEFLTHSDCDGEISPEMCTKVADDLEKLLPRMEELRWRGTGHIAREGGFVSVVRQFIRGCRTAAEANEPLGFY